MSSAATSPRKNVEHQICISCDKDKPLISFRVPGGFLSKICLTCLQQEKRTPQKRITTKPTTSQSSSVNKKNTVIAKKKQQCKICHRNLVINKSNFKKSGGRIAKECNSCLKKAAEKVIPEASAKVIVQTCSDCNKVTSDEELITTVGNSPKKKCQDCSITEQKINQWKDRLKIQKKSPLFTDLNVSSFIDWNNDEISKMITYRDYKNFLITMNEKYDENSDPETESEDEDSRGHNLSINLPGYKDDDIICNRELIQEQVDQNLINKLIQYTGIPLEVVKKEFSGLFYSLLLKSLDGELLVACIVNIPKKTAFSTISLREVKI